MGLYTLFIGTALVCAFIFDITLLYYLAYVCLGIYLYACWYTPRMLDKLTATRSLNSHAFLGDEVEVSLRVGNPGRLTLPWLSVWDSVPLELSRDRGTQTVVSLPAKSETTLRYVIKPKRRGFYRLGPMYLGGGDLFGFTNQAQAQRPASHITVYPRVTRLESLGLPSRLPFGTLSSRQKIYQDPTRPQGIRDYIVGDSLRHIHWKASGHLRRLVVKTFEPAVSLEAVIALNLHRDDYQETGWRDGSELAVEIAASLAAHLHECRQSVGLHSNGLDPMASSGSFDPSSGRLESLDDTTARVPIRLAPRSGKAQLMRILEELARIQATTSSSFAEWIADTSIDLSWGVTVLAVTPTADEPTCAAMHTLVRNGFNPILIVTEPVYFAPVRERARQLGFTAYRITDRRELGRWQKDSAS